MDDRLMTPRKIVEELDRYIVGQDDAKRAVAIALRHRWRRSQLDPELQEDITPKNILMIGPTGVGKTEVARRLARLLHVPFIKVEATKFTEVGYVGRDVDAMVRDLVETSVRMVKEERSQAVQDRAERIAEDRLVDAIVPFPDEPSANVNPLEALFGGARQNKPSSSVSAEERHRIEDERRKVREKLRMKAMEHEVVEVEVEDAGPALPMMGNLPGSEENQMNLGEMFSGILPKRTKRRKMTVAEARKVLTQEEAQKLIDTDAAHADAVWRAEQEGIIFIDEFDKIASSSKEGHGPDVSREGVQRDILPIVEGSTVNTKYGPVKTDHILFIAAGAFHVAKPSDLIPELQGRFPIRVEFNALTEEDFYKILTEPHHSLIKQYKALLGAEGVEVEFDDGALWEMARYAYQVNRDTENIGARRLHTILEKVLEELNFSAPELSGQKIPITATYVQQRLAKIAENIDINRYIL
ncbi:ATP-dependent protease ATPase subunit HslU [Sulfobacillus sp. hq2]|uniref:ATP-dependent protease ATPase subunit HslU n=1 Tax=Sulfobacillus thermotolerans TaxID=338644 RepID=A0ABM6RSY6_9FIRM|nr:ATP-dependent protease ATPase subunit HslU [Sulfobacillus sp. hq2]AUW94549.1 HslU--HslV peptidase ATPase subunit [Sulfobacillus thermotolerans]MCY0909067.1 ATP-dependent protease ATPase subunit HslU [Sulfobacillus thermotolerans]POB09157.1 HslU--HslV peptidase ATPase subunit [Sulfobacillus sp. hq2]